MSRVRQFVFNNAVGLLALGVALGGTSYAVTSKRFVGSDGVVHACARTKTGAVRLVRGSAKCKRSEQKVVWSQKGPAGSNGTNGAPGPAGSIQGAAAGGDLTGTYPNPTIAAEPAPVAVGPAPGGSTEPCQPPNPPVMVYCGTTSSHWFAGEAVGPGIQVWRDRLGAVHIRGEADHPSVNGNGTIVFLLPPDLRPKTMQALPVMTSPLPVGQFQSGSGAIRVDPDGYVELDYSSLAGATEGVFVGDVSFRTDT